MAKKIYFGVLALGFCLNILGADSGVTSLATAVVQGDKEKVSFFLQNGANPNIKDSAGDSILHLAIRHGKRVVSDTGSDYVLTNDAIDIIKLLIAYGADLQAEDSRGRTPEEAVYFDDLRAWQVIKKAMEEPPRLGFM